MAEVPEVLSVTRKSADEARVMVRVHGTERSYSVRAERGAPLTVLVADEALQSAVRDWPELYRDLMARCRELLRQQVAAAA